MRWSMRRESENERERVMKNDKKRKEKVLKQTRNCIFKTALVLRVLFKIELCLQSHSPVPLCLLCSYVPITPALEGCWKARSPTDEMSPYGSSSEGPPRGTSSPLLLMVVALFKTAEPETVRHRGHTPLHIVAKHGTQREGTTTDDAHSGATLAWQQRQSGCSELVRFYAGSYGKYWKDCRQSKL